jgi:uncharacterized protein (DUF1501 family)
MAAAFDSQAVPPRNSAKFLEEIAKRDPADNHAMALVRDSYRAVPNVAESLSSILRGAGGAPAAKDSSAGDSLDIQLNAVARCVSAGLPTRVYSVSINGFDTHAEQREDHKRLIGVVDRAVTGFMKRMHDDKRGQNVVLMAYSEFGRRVEANASDGTDHGTSGPVFIAGRAVQGGFYGEDPSLTDLDDGNLKVTTDFRAVYNELLTKTLGSDPEPVLGAARQEIGFISA